MSAIGAGNNPIYVGPNGEATPSTETIGSNTKPVKMVNGVLMPIDKELHDKTTVTVVDHGEETADVIAKIIVDGQEYTIHAKASGGGSAFVVTFKDWDASIIKQEPVLKSGNATPPTPPEHEGYYFVAWSGNYTNVQKDEIVVATYAASAYEANFYYKTDGDWIKRGETQSVAYGGTPEDPGRPEVSGWTAGPWTPAIGPIYADQDYYSTYTKDTELFTVIFLDGDGNEFSKVTNVASGTTVGSIKPSTNPSKTQTAQYTYTFSSWSKSDSDTITGDTTITSNFTEATRYYEVEFLNGDGGVHDSKSAAYGVKIGDILPSTNPTKTATATTTYTFSGWNYTTDQTVTDDVSITSNYTSSTRYYTIYFVNNGGTVLQSTPKYTYGSTPSYNGSTPVAEGGVSGVTYTFNGWNPTITSVTGNKTYTAKYTDNAVRVHYYNGTTLMASVPVASGTAWNDVTRPSTTPTKSGDKEWKTYVFNGWKLSDGSNPPSTITSDINVYATFVGGEKQQYTVTFINGTKYDSSKTTLSTVSVDYGTKLKDVTKPTTTPTKASTTQYSYTFDDKWTNGSTNTGDSNVYSDDFEITEATSFYAHYATSLNSYTIQFVNNGGTVLQSSEWEYGSTPVYSGSTPKTETEHRQYVDAFDHWRGNKYTDNVIHPVDGACTYTACYEELYESDWTTITPSNLVVEDWLNAPVPYGFNGPVRLRVVDKGNVNVGGSTSGTVTLMTIQCLKNSDGSVYYKRFDDSSNQWSTSEISDWMKDTLPGLFTQGKSGTDLTNANKFLSFIKQPTLSTWIYGTDHTARETLANWKFWLPTYTQMGGDEPDDGTWKSGYQSPKAIKAEETCFSFYIRKTGSYAGEPYGDDICLDEDYRNFEGEYVSLRSASVGSTDYVAGVGWGGNLALHGGTGVAYTKNAVIMCLTMK